MNRFADAFFKSLFLSACVMMPVSHAAAAEVAPPREPVIAGASDEAKQAMVGFRKPAGIEVDLFAAEPLVANPVAFCIDGRGRFFVCESFRQNRGVTDNRGHDQAWLDADLAAQSVADREAYHRRLLGEKASEYTEYDDRIRLLVDTDGDKRADRATVFASGFNQLVDGSGAGVLARNGDVYFTCIPNLWLLKDDNNDGVADSRRALHHGYGVRVAFRGHDLHGLIVGPDGKLYFSIGDRGYNIEHEGRQLVNPESGAVFRCNLDGSNLEVVATGLRNPQELAFDDFGNLFTGDNNSDSGDRARWVYIVEGSDSGWRMSYQYLADRGPFNREKIWHPQHPDTPAYIVPPVANIADGPSGLAYYPGSGFGDDFRGRFFLCDFRGDSGRSGIRSFRVRPKGAFFELVDDEQPIWNVLGTDLSFGPDGGLYVSDWVNGWNGEGKGRIYRFWDPAHEKSPLVAQVRDLLASGMSGRSNDELVRLLAHVDQRVRLEAQFELASRNAIDSLAQTAAEDSHQLARLHGIWGLGQIGDRGGQRSAVVARLSGLLADQDAEIRGQAAKVLGDLRGTNAAAVLIELLADDSLRVQAFAAMALGKMKAESAIMPVIGMLADNDGQDPIVQHAGIMALTWIGNRDPLLANLAHDSVAARRAVVVALRRLQDPAVAQALGDAEPAVVLEAARAIHDVPIPAAMPNLAALLRQPTLSLPTLRRSLNANFRLGQLPHAKAVADAAANDDLPESMRLEALEMLRVWNAPSNRDRVLGMWRPLSRQQPLELKPIVATVLPSVLAGPEAVRGAGAKLAAEFGIKDVAPALQRLTLDQSNSAATRADALTALVKLGSDDSEPVARQCLESEHAELRHAARAALADLGADDAVSLLAGAVTSSSTHERQNALALLGKIGDDASARVVSQALEKLLAGAVPADTRLDVIEAARQFQSPTLRQKIDEYQASLASEDPTAAFRDSLVGGSEERGRRIFFEKAEVSCVRCHRVDGIGGKVGPDLSQIGLDKQRPYLLEAIVAPNRAIAKGFETVMLADDEGLIHVGILKQENDSVIQIMTADGTLKELSTDSIEERRSGKSAMPEDLLKHLTAFEIRDLIEFLAHRKSETPEG